MDLVWKYFVCIIQQISEIKNTTSQSLEIKLKGTKIQTPKIYTER